MSEKYKSEFTEARLNLLPDRYVRCRIWYDKEDKHGNVDAAKPPLILESTGSGKDRWWKVVGGRGTYNNKDLVDLIHYKIDMWQELSKKNSVSVDFTDIQGHPDYLEDIFLKGTVSADRFPNYRENPNLYKGHRTRAPSKKSCPIKVNFRGMI